MCSNDNPFTESQFRTLKYRPDFPERFGSAQHSRAHCGPFFRWYNSEHRHGGIGLPTPHDVHYGLAEASCRRARPRRRPRRPPRALLRKPPEPPRFLPTVAWINEPKEDTSTQ